MSDVIIVAAEHNNGSGRTVTLPLLCSASTNLVSDKFRSQVGSAVTIVLSIVKSRPPCIDILGGWQVAGKVGGV